MRSVGWCLRGRPRDSAGLQIERAAERVKHPTEVRGFCTRPPRTMIRFILRSLAKLPGPEQEQEQESKHAGTRFRRTSRRRRRSAGASASVGHQNSLPTFLSPLVTCGSRCQLPAPLFCHYCFLKTDLFFSLLFVLFVPMPMEKLSW